VRDQSRVAIQVMFDPNPPSSAQRRGRSPARAHGVAPTEGAIRSAIGRMRGVYLEHSRAHAYARTRMSAIDADVPAVSCAGLVKKFVDVTAVNGVDLAIARGECFGMLGPNGAGKTTTIEMLEGLTAPDAGTIRVLGEDWRGGSNDALRARVGIALQETELPEKATVDETLSLFASFYPKRKKIDDVVKLLELDEKRASRVGKLSGGQRQRLALGCALVGAPDVLFLDEPTTGLDPQARLKVWDVVQAFRAEGGTVVLTTHYMEEAQRLCQRIAIFDHGKVIALGTTDELLARLGSRAVVEVTPDRAIDADALAKVDGVVRVHKRADAYALAVADGSVLPRVLAEVTRQGAHAKSVSSRDATLEDVFVHLTGTALRDA
jgi:ABC-2 type transport system ATP-binding protein